MEVVKCIKKEGDNRVEYKVINNEIYLHIIAVETPSINEALCWMYPIYNGERLNMVKTFIERPCHIADCPKFINDIDVRCVEEGDSIIWTLDGEKVFSLDLAKNDTRAILKYYYTLDDGPNIASFEVSKDCMHFNEKISPMIDGEYTSDTCTTTKNERSVLYKEI